MKERIELVRGRSNLSKRHQCRMLSLNRSSLYYRPLGEKPENLKLMRLMDEHTMKEPAEGIRSMQLMLKGKGYHVNYKRVRRLLRKMGHRTIYPRKNLSKLGEMKYIRPYLLRDLKICRANQAWSIDITYIPMARGFMYCTAVIDIYSRKIMGWGISNSLEAKWCVQVMEDAIRRHGKPEIINSDQGSQFTSCLWTYTMKEKEIEVSMDGKGRAVDNRWIERFWRTLKHNRIYLNPPKDGLDLYLMIRDYIQYYNEEKFHHTFKEKPSERYRNAMKKQQIRTEILTKKAELVV